MKITKTANGFAMTTGNTSLEVSGADATATVRNSDGFIQARLETYPTGTGGYAVLSADGSFETGSFDQKTCELQTCQLL